MSSRTSGRHTISSILICGWVILGVSGCGDEVTGGYPDLQDELDQPADASDGDAGQGEIEIHLDLPPGEPDGGENECDDSCINGLGEGCDLVCPTEGVCAEYEGTPSVICVDETWVCDFPGLDGYERGTEMRCDGKDNDCNGLVDEELDNPVLNEELCPTLSQGVCAGVSRYRVCREGEWDCDLDDAISDIHEEEETTCDGRDNDCDGVIDEDPDCPVWRDLEVTVRLLRDPADGPTESDWYLGAYMSHGRRNDEEDPLNWMVLPQQAYVSKRFQPDELWEDSFTIPVPDPEACGQVQGGEDEKAAVFFVYAFRDRSVQDGQHTEDQVDGEGDRMPYTGEPIVAQSARVVWFKFDTYATSGPATGGLSTYLAPTWMSANLLAIVPGGTGGDPFGTPDVVYELTDLSFDTLTVSGITVESESEESIGQYDPDRVTTVSIFEGDLSEGLLTGRPLNVPLTSTTDFSFALTQPLSAARQSHLNEDPDAPPAYMRYGFEVPMAYRDLAYPHDQFGSADMLGADSGLCTGGRYVGLYYLEPVTFIDHSTWMSLNSEVLQLQYGQGIRAGWNAIYFNPAGGGGLEPIPDALLASGAIFSDISCRIGQ